MNEFTCPLRGCGESFATAREAITHVNDRHGGGYTLTYGETKVSGHEIADMLEATGDVVLAEKVRDLVATRALARETRAQAPIDTPAGPLYPGERIARLHYTPRWGKPGSRRDVLVGSNPGGSSTRIAVRATTGGHLSYQIDPHDITEIER